MDTTRTASDVVNDAYEEVALILGGFLARNPVAGEAAWKLTGEVSETWHRARSRMESESCLSLHELHPSISSLLAAIRSSRTIETTK